MGPFSLYTLRTNAHPFPLQPAFPSSEYYGCVRLPPCHQPSSFVLVRFTGEPCVTGTCRVSLVPDLSLRSRHARLPRRTLRTLLYHCWSGSSVLASSTLNAWPSATTHFRGCMWLQGSRPPVACSVPCLHFRCFVLHVVAGHSVHCRTEGRHPRYLRIRKTRYWWVATPSR